MSVILSRRRFLTLLAGAAASPLILPAVDWHALARELARPARTYFVGGMAQFSPADIFTTDDLHNAIVTIFERQRQLGEFEGMMRQALTTAKWEIGWVDEPPDMQAAAAGAWAEARRVR